MIPIVDRHINDFQRDAKNPAYLLRVSAGVFVITLFIFGMMGIYPLHIILKTKYQLIREMKSVNTIMQNNYIYAAQAEIDLQNHAKEIELLDDYMPVNTNVQNYLLEFVNALSDTGYVVTDVTQHTDTSPNGVISLTINLEGHDYPTEIIKRIEDLKRVSQVKDLKLRYDKEGFTHLTLELSIYTLII
jgi:hypothetical protein